MSASPTEDGDLRFDFYSDWVEYLADHLKSAGYAVQADVPPGDIEIQYFNVRRRHIEPHPRTWAASQGLRCPPQHQLGFDQLRKKVTEGANLNGHLSRTLLDLNFYDGLLNDWGISHFHLGSGVDPEGFVVRSGPLLFALVKPKAFYAIGVRTHLDFGSIELLELVLANWPELIKGHEMRGILGGENFSAREVVELRRVGISSPMTLSNGKSYAPLGGGLTSARIGVAVMMDVTKHRKAIRELERLAVSRIPAFRSSLKALGMTLDVSVRIKLLFQDGRAFVAEPKSGWTLPLH